MSTYEYNPDIRYFDKDQIPSNVYGAELSQSDIENLANGYMTSVQNFNINGKLKKGKIRLENDENGQAKFHFHFFRENLEIPDRILGKRLTEDDKKNLEDGKTISIIKNGKDFYINVDNDLNKIVVSRASQIKLPDSIGNYMLTEKDKETLANSNTLSSRVYKGQDQYFIANVALTKDRKGIEFSNIQQISDKEANKLIQSLNHKEQDQSTLIQEITTASDQSLKTDKDTFNLNKAIDKADSQMNDTSNFINQDEEFFQAVYSKDFNTIDELMNDSEFNLNSNVIEQLATDDNLSDNHKLSIAGYLGLSNDDLDQAAIRKEFNDNVLNAIENHDIQSIDNQLADIEQPLNNEYLLRRARNEFTSLKNLEDDLTTMIEDDAEQPIDDLLDKNSDDKDVQELYEIKTDTIPKSEYILSRLAENSNEDLSKKVLGLDLYASLLNLHVSRYNESPGEEQTEQTATQVNQQTDTTFDNTSYTKDEIIEAIKNLDEQKVNHLISQMEEPIADKNIIQTSFNNISHYSQDNTKINNKTKDELLTAINNADETQVKNILLNNDNNPIIDNDIKEASQNKLNKVWKELQSYKENNPYKHFTYAPDEEGYHRYKNNKWQTQIDYDNIVEINSAISSKLHSQKLKSNNLNSENQHVSANNQKQSSAERIHSTIISNSKPEIVTSLYNKEHFNKYSDYNKKEDNLKPKFSENKKPTQQENKSDKPDFEPEKKKVEKGFKDGENLINKAFSNM